MAAHDVSRATEVRELLDRRGPLIVECAAQGLSLADIGRRFSISAHLVKAHISREQQRRHLAGEPALPELRTFSGKGRPRGSVGLLSDSLLDDLAAAIVEEGTPTPPRLPQVWEIREDPRPEEGDEGIPGFGAWELVHGAGMSAKDAARRLGLRHASQVYEQLAAHKRGLDDRRQARLKSDLDRQARRGECE